MDSFICVRVAVVKIFRGNHQKIEFVSGWENQIADVTIFDDPGKFVLWEWLLDSNNQNVWLIQNIDELKNLENSKM